LVHNRASEEWSVGRIIDWMSGAFAKAGIDNSRADAEILVAAAIGCKRSAVNLKLQDVLSENVLNKLRTFVEQRRSRVPVAYILGEWEFMGLPFVVSRHTLVPRPETEHLVEAALAQIAAGNVKTVLDLCTGCGNIAVSVAKLSAVKSVYASDISLDALNIADLNVVKNAVSGKVLLRKGDLFAAFASDSLGGKIDLLLSNPPYIPEADYNSLAEELKYEPKNALVCPENGLQAYKRIASQAKSFLSADATLLLELNSRLSKEIAEIFKQAGYTDEEIIKDYSGHDRVLKTRFRRK
jgi:release factor glutamine methyltransferase